MDTNIWIAIYTTYAYTCYYSKMKIPVALLASMSSVIALTLTATFDGSSTQGVTGILILWIIYIYI